MRGCDIETGYPNGVLVELLQSVGPDASDKEIRRSIRAARALLIEKIEESKNGRPKPAQGDGAWTTIGRHETFGDDAPLIALHDQADIGFVQSIRETSELIRAITELAAPDAERGVDAHELADVA